MNRSIRLTLALIVLVATAGLRLGAAPQTWVGKLSDSMCNGDHKAMAGGKSDHDCATACIKAGNSYVFVDDKDKKIYKVGNQTLPALAVHVGHEHVTLTGELKGDTITVSKIEMPKAK